MPERPYTLLSCGMSIDGYIDTATDERLVLSNDADLDRVDAVRAESDAILVGAATVRNDNPRLLVRAPSRRAERIARGVPPTPIKVTVTSRAQLDPCAAFFATGDTEKLVYCPTDAVAEARRRLGAAATVVDGGRLVEMCRLSEDLHARGVGRLMVEGGGKVLTQFLTAGLADELHLVVAPFFVGDSRAQRFVGDGIFPWNPERRAELGGGAPDRRCRTPALRALGPFPPGLNPTAGSISALAWLAAAVSAHPEVLLLFGSAASASPATSSGARGIGLYAKLDAYGPPGRRPRHTTPTSRSATRGTTATTRLHRRCWVTWGWPGSEPPSRSGRRRGAPQRDQYSLPGHESRQRHTHADLPCDDVPYAEA